MKSFLIFLVNLFVIIEVLSAQDVCDSGYAFRISQTLLLEDSLFLFMRSGSVYRINPFKWNGTDFISGPIKQISPPDKWITSFGNVSFDLILTLDYKSDRVLTPDSDIPRILIFHLINPVSGRSVDIDDWVKQVVGERSVLSIDINKCYSNVSKNEITVHNWCSLFINHTLEETKHNLEAILHFPKPIEGRPQRMIQYFKPKRQSFYQLNSTTAQGERHLKWERDYNGIDSNISDSIVAVSALTDNRKTGDYIDFDFIEISNNDFVVYRYELTPLSEHTITQVITAKKFGHTNEILCRVSSVEPTQTSFKTTQWPENDPASYKNTSTGIPPQIIPKSADNKRKSLIIVVVVVILVVFVLFLLAFVWFMCFREKAVPPHKHIQSNE